MKVLHATERGIAIEQQLQASQETYSVPYQGQMREIPKLRLPAENLIYRINNGRTRIEQLRRIAQEGLATDFFDGKQESQSAQNMQHQILLEMSKDAKADVYAELQSAKIQRDPLIITRTGVVVNGNRRLAAIRDLVQGDSKKYAGFAHVNVAVLPAGATEQDIEDVETEFQELPETRLSYSWIARRLKMRYQMDVLAVKPEALRAKYHLRSVDDVNRELQQLALVEDYLEFIKKPKHYWEASQTEEIFKRLQQAIEKSAPEKLEYRRLLGFNLIAMGGSLDDRVYKFHRVFGNELDKVSQRYLKENPAIISHMTVKKDEGLNAASDDPLDDMVASSPNPIDCIVESLKSIGTEGNPARRLVQIYETIKSEENAGDIRRLAFQKAQEANRVLSEIDLSMMDPSTKSGIIRQLDSILSLATGLRDQLVI